MSAKLIWLSILQSLLLASGQLTLKLAMIRTPRFAFTWEIIKQFLLNYWFLFTGILFTASTVLWMYILKHYPLSEAYPLTSLAYVFGMLAGVFIFNESSTLPKWIGAVLIIAGAFLLTRK